MMTESVHTPLMQQYHAIKAQYPDALLLFQVGDFYELFYEDARKAALFLGITLTKRGKADGEPIPLCGVPRHTYQHYVVKLVQGGFRLVICDQQGEVVPGKIVDRKVTAVFTPGTLHDPLLLDPKRANIFCLLEHDAALTVLIFVEVVTGNCFVTLLASAQAYLVEAELARYAPQEIIINASTESDRYATLLSKKGHVITKQKRDLLPADARAWIEERLTAFSQPLFERTPLLVQGLQAVFQYLTQHLPEALSRMSPFEFYAPHDFLFLDTVAQASLELVKSLHDGSVEATVWQVLDEAATSMGSRIIRKWLLQPLADLSLIQQRQGIVGFLVQSPLIRKSLYAQLKIMGDAERIIGRIVLQKASQQDYVYLQRIVVCMRDIASLLSPTKLASAYRHGIDGMACYASMIDILNRFLPEEEISGRRIRAGWDSELDELRALADQGERAVALFEERERQTTGIASLKIKRNGPHGYGIEITHAQRQHIPGHYRLVQTLVNRDRFVTPELLELQYALESASAQAAIREEHLYAKFMIALADQAVALKQIVVELVVLDGLLGFAEAAVRYRYVCPEFSADQGLILEESRHPVIERICAEKSYDKPFIPHTICMGPDKNRLWMITGPNMGGKSTLLRQVALVAIMAQAGSFVPARRAILPVFDQLFTRIGASDQLAMGKSTFFVEMEEVARICQRATARSLIILDELGRGTSTQDGMALGQAILEFLRETVSALTLCATHYHELATRFHEQGVAGCYHMGIARTSKGLVITHTLQSGVALSSFGIIMAQDAGLPHSLVVRAEQLLSSPVCPVNNLAETQIVNSLSACSRRDHEQYEEVMVLLRTVRPDDLSPRQALDLLARLHERVVYTERIG